MRVALCLCAYNEGRYIQPFLRHIPAWVEKILILASDSPWNGPPSDLRHETWEKAATLRDPRIEIARLRWQNEALQRTWGLGRLFDYDWVLTLDADEFFTSEDWERIRKSLENAPKRDCSAFCCSFQTYWKDFDHVLYPPDSHQGTIAVRPDRTTFTFARCLFMDDMQKEADVTCHHLSWVKSDVEIWQKIRNWTHATDFDPERWFHEVWEKWYHGMANIHPYNRSAQQTTAVSHLPSELRTILS